MANYTSTHTGAVIDAAVTKITATSSSATELNLLDGVTATTAEINILDGVTSTAAEINLLDGVTATTAEINYIDGVTSNIQTQLNLKAPIAGATFTGTTTFATLSDGTIAVTAWVDEDNMDSNSATLIPTQQSVKAYVDSQVTAQDLDATTDSGTIAIDLDSETLTIAGGEGIDTSASSNTITITGEEASTSNKGVASFSSDNFSVSSGVVTIKDSGVILGTETTGNYVATAVAGTGISVSGATGNVTISSAITAGDGLTLNTADIDIDAAQTTITSILATDLKIGEDDQTKIDFETADTINFYAGNEKQLILTDGALTPGADNILDLGSSGVEFKDAYFDGTVTSDAFAGPLTGDVTGNVSGTAATVTGAAQSAITSLGTLTTLTVDSVIINGTTIGHTSDTDLITLADGNVTIAGELDLTTLDVSGDADIDGTLEADAITVGGSALNTVIAGVTVANATLSATSTVTDSTANTNFPVVFHDESNALLDDTGALRYNPSTGELLVPKLTVAGTTTQVDTVTMEAENAIIFEGATADSNETTLSIVDPTADHTQYLINQGGYIPLLAAATTTAISSTPAEINLLDGSSANTVVNSKAVIYGSSGELAGTLSTAAQANITSLGTLTALTVDDVAINGKVITMTGSSSDTAVFTAGTNGTLSIVTTDAAAAAANIQITADGTVDIDSSGALTLDSGAAINLEPASGSAILLDGTISVDAGVVTGATSITSTAFVGALTGNVTGNASGTAATVTTAAQSNITSLGTLTTLTVDNVIINGTTIGHTSDTDLITIADGNVTIAGELDLTTLDVSGNADIDGTLETDALSINGTAVSSTAAELNVLDGYTGSVTELNYLDTLHATGVTNTEFDYLDGVTSNIQTQLDALPDTAGTNITLSGTTLNVDDAFLINSGNDTTSGTITAGGFTTTGNLTLGGHAVNDIDIGSEFVDADDHLMSAGAIKEKIEDYGYTTNTGDITGVTAGTNCSGGGTSGSVTINVDDAFLKNDADDVMAGHLNMADDKELRLGNDSDLRLVSNNSNTFIDNYLGNMSIRQTVDDGDIIFQSDDGSGGLATYITLDGSATQTLLHQDTVLTATKKLYLDNGLDTYIDEVAANVIGFTTGGGERMRIDTTGLGIGTASPAQKLHVAGGQARFDDHISIQPTKFLYLDGGADTYIHEVAGNEIAFNTGGAERMRIDTTGLGIGTDSPAHKIDVVGTAGLSTGTAWTNTSDKRIKTNVENIENGLDKILKLRPVSFNYTEDYLKANPELSGSKRYNSFIAQEYEEVFPDAVTSEKELVVDDKVIYNDLKQFTPHDLNMYLVKAIQEMKSEIDELKLKLGEQNG